MPPNQANTNGSPKSRMVTLPPRIRHSSKAIAIRVQQMAEVEREMANLQIPSENDSSSEREESRLRVINAVNRLFNPRQEPTAPSQTDGDNLRHLPRSSNSTHSATQSDQHLAHESSPSKASGDMGFLDATSQPSGSDTPAMHRAMASNTISQPIVDRTSSTDTFMMKEMLDALKVDQGIHLAISFLEAHTSVRLKNIRHDIRENHVRPFLHDGTMPPQLATVMLDYAEFGIWAAGIFAILVVAENAFNCNTVKWFFELVLLLCVLPLNIGAWWRCSSNHKQAVEDVLQRTPRLVERAALGQRLKKLEASYNIVAFSAILLVNIFGSWDWLSSPEAGLGVMCVLSSVNSLIGIHHVHMFRKECVYLHQQNDEALLADFPQPVLDTAFHEELNTTISKLIKDVTREARKEDEIRALRIRPQAADAKLKMLSVEVERLIQSKKEASREHAELQEKSTNSQKDLDDAISRADSNHLLAQRSARDHTKLLFQHSEVVVKQAALTTRFRKECGQAQAQIYQLDGEVREIREEVSSLLRDKNGLETRADKAEKDANSARDELRSVRAQHSCQCQLQDVVSEYGFNTARLRDEIQAKTLIITNLKSQLLIREGTIQSQNLKLEEESASQETLRGLISSEEAHRNHVATQLREATLHIGECTATHEDQIKALNTSVDTRKSLEMQLHQAREESSLLMERQAFFEDCYNQGKSQFERLRKGHEELLDLYEAQKGRVADLVNENDESREHVAALDTTKTNLETELAENTQFASCLQEAFEMAKCKLSVIVSNFKEKLEAKEASNVHVQAQLNAAHQVDLTMQRSELDAGYARETTRWTERLEKAISDHGRAEKAISRLKSEQEYYSGAAALTATKQCLKIASLKEEFVTMTRTEDDRRRIQHEQATRNAESIEALHAKIQDLTDENDELSGVKEWSHVEDSDAESDRTSDSMPELVEVSSEDEDNSTPSRADIEYAERVNQRWKPQDTSIDQYEEADLAEDIESEDGEEVELDYAEEDEDW